jgi:hypothetical protein
VLHHGLALFNIGGSIVGRGMMVGPRFSYGPLCLVLVFCTTFECLYSQLNTYSLTLLPVLFSVQRASR